MTHSRLLTILDQKDNTPHNTILLWITGDIYFRDILKRWDDSEGDRDQLDHFLSRDLKCAVLLKNL